MKHRVKYTAQGLLSGKSVGDVVSFDDADTRHLLALGLIETEEDYQARQEAKAQAEAESEPEEPDSDELEEVRKALETEREVSAEKQRLIDKLLADQATDQKALSRSSAEAAKLSQALEKTRQELANAQATQQQGETGTLMVPIKPEWLSSVVSPERIAELIAEEEDRLLEPHKGKSGWYQFGEGDDTVKVQGRDAALTELAKRLNAEGGDDAEPDDTASGQQPQA